MANLDHVPLLYRYLKYHHVPLTCTMSKNTNMCFDSMGVDKWLVLSNTRLLGPVIKVTVRWPDNSPCRYCQPDNPRSQLHRVSDYHTSGLVNYSCSTSHRRFNYTTIKSQHHLPYLSKNYKRNFESRFRKVRNPFKKTL